MFSTVYCFHTFLEIQANAQTENDRLKKRGFVLVTVLSTFSLSFSKYNIINLHKLQSSWDESL